MTDQIASVAVDYGAIITQLQFANGNMRRLCRESGSNTTYTRVGWLQELCTVAVNGGRETGRTKAALALVNNDTVVVVPNTSLAKEFETRFNGQLQWQIGAGQRDMHDTDLNIITNFDVLKEFADRPRQVVNVSMDPELTMEEARIEMEKAFAQAKVEHERRSKMHLPKYKRFILDDASYVFAEVGTKRFYKWVDLHCEVEDPEIILLG